MPICRPLSVFSHFDLMCYLCHWQFLRNSKYDYFSGGGVLVWRNETRSREFTSLLGDRELLYQSKHQQDKTSPLLALHAKNSGLTSCAESLDGGKQPNNQSKITKTRFCFQIYILCKHVSRNPHLCMILNIMIHNIS